MDDQAIQGVVKDVMSGLFGIDVSQIGPESSIATVEHWDSLQHVNLIMALEQEFGVMLDVDDALEMTTFPVVCEMLAKYLDGKA